MHSKIEINEIAKPFVEKRLKELADQEKKLTEEQEQIQKEIKIRKAQEQKAIAEKKFWDDKTLQRRQKQ